MGGEDTVGYLKCWILSTLSARDRGNSDSANEVCLRSARAVNANRGVWSFMELKAVIKAGPIQ